MTRLDETFAGGLLPDWEIHESGGGTVTPGAAGLTLRITPGDGYHNAQIADYRYADFALLWRPPVTMTVTARASLPGERLRGTAGFGFWNHPFSPDVRGRLPRLPQAIWFFFGSPPNDMQLAGGVPGSGWKAATLDAGRPAALRLIPLALPAVLLMQSGALRRRLYPPIQRRLGISEALLDGALLATDHTYTIDWRSDGATFAVDGATVLEAPVAPRGPLGFVAWIDNQYAIVTPRGRFGFGVVPLAEAQSLKLRSIRISRP